MAMQYRIGGVVTAIESDKDTVVFENKKDGNVWAFYGVEGWAIGDNVVAIMSNNDTKYDVTDDSIVSVRKGVKYHDNQTVQLGTGRH